MLDRELPFINDAEDTTVPEALPFIVDAHVHLFPEPVFKALWEWFKKHAWQIRYQMDSVDVIKFLLQRGVGHIVALQYAHKPGIARRPRHRQDGCT